MGFFDRLKSMTNSLTGGAADVSIKIEASELANEINVFVTAVIGSSDIKVDQVYLLVKSIESIEISAQEILKDKNNNRQRSHREDSNENDDDDNIDDIKVDTFVFPEKEYQIDGAQTLYADETYSWTYELKITGGNIQPSYRGKFSSHQWFFQAGLSARGNDPDSGWKSCEIK